jgi:hypothetical protein
VSNPALLCSDISFVQLVTPKITTKHNTISPVLLFRLFFCFLPFSDQSLQKFILNTFYVLSIYTSNFTCVNTCYIKSRAMAFEDLSLYYIWNYNRCGHFRVNADALGAHHVPLKKHSFYAISTKH